MLVLVARAVEEHKAGDMMGGMEGPACCYFARMLTRCCFIPIDVPGW